MSAEVVILGAGGHARVVADALSLSRPQTRVIGHLALEPAPDDAPELGAWLGSDLEGAEISTDTLIAIGIGYVDAAGAQRRADLVEAIDDSRLLTIVHPRASIAGAVSLGAGAFVGAGAVVGVGTTIGRAAIINSSASVDHDCVVGANAHIGPGVVMSGGVTVGEATLVGVGAVVRQGVIIGDHAVVGAGSVVVSKVASGSIVFGVPAGEPAR